MTAGNQSVTKSSFRLSMSFMATGIAFFLIFHILSLSTLAAWMGHNPRAPQGWTEAHLFVLAWGTLIAMGAVYQLIHVVLQQNIFSIKLGFVQYCFTVIGVAGLLYGFFRVQFHVLACGASLAFIGLLLFVFNLLCTLLKAGKWDSVTVSTLCAVIYLLVTALLGMLMGLDFTFNMLGGAHERLFGAHIWLGAVGWFGMLITGFSYKLLPMFYLSHGYPTKLQPYIIVLWNLGVWVGAGAFLSGAPLSVNYLAWLLLTAALILYSIHVLQIRKHRHKANPGAGVKFAVYLVFALTMLAVALALYFPLFARQGISAAAAIWIGWMYLAGWVGLTILGFMSKIIPFLWWTYKYGSLVGKQKVPKLADMISDKLTKAFLIALGCTVLAVLLGIGADWRVVTRIGGAAFSVFSILYLFLIVRVFAK